MISSKHIQINKNKNTNSTVNDEDRVALFVLNIPDELSTSKIRKQHDQLHQDNMNTSLKALTNYLAKEAVIT